MGTANVDPPRSVDLREPTPPGESTVGDLHAALYKSRVLARQRGHDWDVADVIAVIDAHGSPSTTQAVVSTGATLRVAVQHVRAVLELCVDREEVPPRVMVYLREAHKALMIPSTEVHLYRPDEGNGRGQHAGALGMTPKQKKARERQQAADRKARREEAVEVDELEPLPGAPVDSRWQRTSATYFGPES